jgi:hypothetical protein
MEMLIIHPPDFVCESRAAQNDCKLIDEPREREEREGAT